MTRLKYLLLVAALLAGTTTAHAATEVIARSGAWTAFAGHNVKGIPTCGMQNIGSSGRTTMIKWQTERDMMYLQLKKQSWNIPLSTVMPLTMQFEKAEPIKGTAVSHDNSGQFIDSVFKTADFIRSFMDSFMAADRMTITFPDGSEGSWLIDMDGAEKIAREFMQCVKDYRAKYGTRATQPHRGDSTQPDSSGTKPTQPFRGGGNDSNPLKDAPTLTPNSKSPKNTKMLQTRTNNHKPKAKMPRPAVGSPAVALSDKRNRSASSNNAWVKCVRQAGAWPGPGGWHYYERHIPAMNACVSATVGAVNNQKRQ